MRGGRQLYREEYYLLQKPPARMPDESDRLFAARRDKHEAALTRAAGRAAINVAKQRDGATGTVQVRFDGATSRMWCGPPGGGAGASA